MARYEEDSKVYGDAGMRIPPRWEHETVSIPDDVQKQMAQFKSVLGNPQPLKSVVIGDLIEMSHSNLHELLERIEILEKRMSPVLISVPAQTQEGPGVRQTYDDSQYVNSMRDLLFLIKNAIDKVNSISTRVQL
jgi:hypothetical protein